VSVLLYVGISLVLPVGVFLFAMPPFQAALSDRPVSRRACGLLTRTARVGARLPLFCRPGSLHLL
jgi:hypothetical protein